MQAIRYEAPVTLAEAIRLMRDEAGAAVVDTPAKLADRDLVFTMVSDPAAFLEVTLGPDGVFSVPGVAPRVLVDSSTVSADASEEVRRAAGERGCELVAAPVSGNPKVVQSGRLTVVASGPELSNSSSTVTVP